VSLSGYPAGWEEISERIKSKAGWRCERCGAPDSGRFERYLDYL